MPRSLLALLLAVLLGCDAAQLNELAKQATGGVMDDVIVTSDRAPEATLTGLAESFERLADTVSQMRDEASVRASVDRFQRLLRQTRRIYDEIEASIRKPDDGARPRPTTAENEALQKAIRRFQAEIGRVSSSTEIRRALVEALLDSNKGESPWEFVGPSGPPPFADLANWPAQFSSPAAEARTAPEEGTVALLDSADRPLHPKAQEMRDRFERMSQFGPDIPNRRLPPPVPPAPPLEGPDLLTIVVENAPADAFQSLMKSCVAATSGVRYSAGNKEGRFVFQVLHAEPLEQVRAKITFGTVTALDQRSRKITVAY